MLHKTGVLEVIIDEEKHSRERHNTPNLTDLLDDIASQVASVLAQHPNVTIIQRYSEHPGFDEIYNAILNGVIVRFSGNEYQAKAMSTVWTNSIIRNSTEN